MRNNLLWSGIAILSLMLWATGCGSTDDGDDQTVEDAQVDTAIQADVNSPLDSTTVETASLDLDSPEDLVAQEVAAEVEEEEVYIPTADEYPLGPYGKTVGTVVRNHVFLEPESGTVMHLSDLYVPNQNPHNPKKILMINSSAGWCTYCKQEAYNLIDIYADYKDKGLEVWFTLFQDYDGYDPDIEFWNQWMNTIKPTYPTLLDTAFEMGAYFNVDATPMNMMIDLETMTIIYLQTGYDKTGILNKLSQLLP